MRIIWFLSALFLLASPALSQEDDYIDGYIKGIDVEGNEHPFRIAEVNDDHIIVDGNHPLAGQELVFDLELVEIK